MKDKMATKTSEKMPAMKDASSAQAMGDADGRVGSGEAPKSLGESHKMHEAYERGQFAGKPSAKDSFQSQPAHDCGSPALMYAADKAPAPIKSKGSSKKE